MIPGLSQALSSDTIVALATPQGRGAIAIVRVSGPRSLEIASGHIQPWPLPPRKLQLCHVRERERLLDRALVASYEAPDSFTGENMVEIFTHGGRVVPASVLGALIQSGAREALPGEFTRRAVLNGKFDITQAEAIADLVDAGSRRMQEAALAQLDGGLSARISDLRNMLLELEALIAYDIDFPEEDDGPVSRERVAAATSLLLEALEQLLATIPVGEMIREGARVVIAGPPNVGKSSLFNALLGQQRAIVTPVPGTTRDAIEAVVDTGRWPIRLIDTAGLRESTDVVERLGIETSEQQIRLAHLVLACGEDSEQIQGTAQAVDRVAPVPVLPVLTKADEAASSRQPGSRLTERSSVEVSARTGTGLAELIAAIELKLSQEYEGEISDVPLLMRTRHVRALGEAKDEVASFEAVWKSGSIPATLAAVHLRAASGALESLVGAIGVEDVLDRVFSSFCVGK